jgi:hypothetical protein
MLLPQSPKSLPSPQPLPLSMWPCAHRNFVQRPCPQVVVRAVSIQIAQVFR